MRAARGVSDISADDALTVDVSLARPGFDLQVQLSLPPRGITVVFGASGAGKTTLLRCIAGLERASGRVVVAGRIWQDSARGLFVPTWQRDLGYVFQEASLFDHLNVQRNLEYGIRRVNKAGAARSLQEAVELLGIAHLAGRMPGELSGGERQRVAIARALATEPALLLLDEPLASLDAPRRREIFPWLERLRDGLSIPMVYITHASDEVARLATHLVLMEQGRVRSSAALEQVLTDPDGARRIGQEPGAVLEAVVMERDAHFGQARVGSQGASFWISDPGRAPGQAVRLRVLARDVTVSLQAHDGALPARLEGIEAHPDPALLWLKLRCGPWLLWACETRRAIGPIAAPASVWCQIRWASVWAEHLSTREPAPALRPI